MGATSRLLRPCMAAVQQAPDAVVLRAVGALTSKPYAFTSRSWELKSTSSVDVLDGVGSNIRVDTRGTEVMRILPRLNEDVNEEWISDKSRFSYDGLKTQRLNQPMVRDKDNNFVPIGWDKARILMKNVVLKLDRHNAERKYVAHAVLGPYVDMEAAIQLRAQFLWHFPNVVFTLQEQPSFAVSDFRHNFKLNTGLAGMEQADVILLVGCNPRKEAPLLNTRLRKAVLHHGARVASVGCYANLTYAQEHLGITPATLKQLADGTHPFCDVLKSAQNPVIIVSNKALQRADGESIFAASQKIASSCGMIRDDWDGFNVLHQGANTVGLMEIGFDTRDSAAYKNDGKQLWQDSKLLFLMGADDVDGMEVADDAFVVYQGHHGDRGAAVANLVLPGPAYTEKSATYVNTEGRVQGSKRAFFPPGHARDDAETLAALFGEDWQPEAAANAGMELLAPGALNAMTAPRLLPTDRIPIKGAPDVHLEFLEAPLGAPIDNFYMTDPITRASAVMAKATRLSKVNNFDVV
ncbi:NADH-ubiquinone oxidoreductase 75 kDa subunit [Porphyridium purpureum]|uniref:NADH-ubiquinone oxidoreductase 75 kDa subunit n=1 Tax=Porphyridium purpureum TaxID=35688 RepID=A0A5J4YV78_PORPP|nr:NADH-ubiquinone oxidoreductase 75 kDa subunit [Porphyridium purpureum]|eukprot:POR6347..scf209_3